jgi:hypothetical protein
MIWVQVQGLVLVEILVQVKHASESLPTASEYSLRGLLQGLVYLGFLDKGLERTPARGDEFRLRV